MTELNGCEPKKIKVLGPYTFSIGNTNDFTEYLRGGTVTQVKMPAILSFKSLEVAQENPEFLITDFGKFNNSPQLHKAFDALHIYVEKNNAKPRPWNDEDAKQLIDIIKEIKGDVELDEEFLGIFAKVLI